MEQTKTNNEYEALILNTLEFMGLWEQINNPDFKGNEFVTFKKEVAFGF